MSTGWRAETSRALDRVAELTAMLRQRDAQVARLREALEKIASMEIPHWIAVDNKMHDIAAEALAQSPAAALDALKREVAERVRGVCADAAHHERVDGNSCCQTEEIIRGLDLSALLAEARHEG